MDSDDATEVLEHLVADTGGLAGILEEHFYKYDENQQNAFFEHCQHCDCMYCDIDVCPF